MERDLVRPMSSLGMLLALLSGLPAQTINLSGKITNTSGSPIPGAIVTLAGKNLKDTTDAGGAYSIAGSPSGVNPSRNPPGAEKIFFRNGVLRVIPEKSSPVAFELLDMQGNLLAKEFHPIKTQGEYQYDVAAHTLAGNMHFLRVLIGANASTVRTLMLPNGGGMFTAFQTGANISHGEALAKLEAAVDSLAVSAAGYVNKVERIASYQGVVDITLAPVAASGCDSKDKTPAPTPVNTTFTGKAFTGPHEVVVETDPGFAAVTIFRPKDLAPGKNYPIVAWGQGGCSKDGLSNREFQAEIASHGYLVFSDGAPNGSGSGSMGSDPVAMGKPLLDYIHWAVQENKRPCSPYYQSMDTAKTAAFGWSCGGLMAEGAGASNDPKLTTFMLNSSGMTSFNQKVIDAFKTPVMILLGGSSDIAYANGTRDYEAVQSLPALLLSTDVGHGGTYSQDNGGSFAQVDLAWLNWWLKGDTGPTGKGYLIGANCGLCGDAKWTIKSKNIP